MNRHNHYATLDVDPCASGAEIKLAFRTLAQRFHPDVTKDVDGEQKFKDVAEAYRTLKRRDSKLAYDHRMNNDCNDEADLTISYPAIATYNWGLIFFQYISWFWPNRNGPGK